MNTKEKLNERLERIRKEKKMTAKQVARAIEVPESTYREWEYGRGLKLPPLQKLSQVFAISVTELVTGDKPNLQNYINELEDVERRLMSIRLNLASLI